MGSELKVGLVPYAPYVYPCVFTNITSCKGKPGINYDLVINILAINLLGYKNITIIKSDCSKARTRDNASEHAEWGGLLGKIIFNNRLCL